MLESSKTKSAAPKSTEKEKTVKVSKATSEILEAELAQRQTFSGLSQKISGGRFAKLREIFKRLYRSSPQVLLFEGGTDNERLGAALYFATGLNCEQSKKPSESDLDPNFAAEPCLQCESCRLFSMGEHRDLLLLDGRAESIKIDMVRSMRQALAEPPHTATKRVVVLAEAHALVDAAANSLLKLLEEPKKNTVFILATSQRERLLPTLISRSWVLTLPWPHPHCDVVFSSKIQQKDNTGGECQEKIQFIEAFNHIKPFEQALLNLIAHNTDYEQGNAKSWMSLTAQRGSIDKYSAIQFITHCRRSLCVALGLGQALSSSLQQGKALHAVGLELRTLPVLATLFASFSHKLQWELGVLLDEAEEALVYGLNVTLVLDRMAVRLFLLSR